MKAYAISPPDHEWSAVVFATTRGRAKALGGGYGLEFLDVRSRRERGLDVFAEAGEVPRDVLVEHGWLVEVGP